MVDQYGANIPGVSWFVPVHRIESCICNYDTDGPFEAAAGPTRRRILCAPVRSGHVDVR
jgi:hypothetical protein